jgi:ribosomal protein L22
MWVTIVEHAEGVVLKRYRFAAVTRGMRQGKRSWHLETLLIEQITLW